MDDKRLAAQEALKLIEEGMTIGLGSGSTVNRMLEELAISVRAGLQIKGVPSSIKTARLATELGIPIIDLSGSVRIDLGIDGTNEVDRNLNLIKGGGGSLVREKIIAESTEKLIIIADEGKSVPNFTGKLPVEVIPFGWEATARRIMDLAITPVLRNNNDGVFLSDNGNFILDCAFDPIWEPGALHEALKMQTGVIETGLFIDMADTLITAGNGKVNVINKK